MSLLLSQSQEEIEIIMDVSLLLDMSGVTTQMFNNVFAYGKKYVIQSYPNLLIAPTNCQGPYTGGGYIWQFARDS